MGCLQYELQPIQNNFTGNRTVALQTKGPGTVDMHCLTSTAFPH